MTAVRICARCQRALGSSYETITVDSASGARPNVYAHHQGDPACSATKTGKRPSRK
ncbi:hypothetical protein [Streptomyces sp. NPDC090022]|uniref:hypothetical protein n=1 Tax=Streptomyces sp. NPDC090022 TaxID=3365920 RepID=UPI00382F0BC3